MAVTAVLGILGAAINMVKVPLFFGMDFLFGGALSLIPAILFGPVHGLVSAAIAALPTLLHWHHPYALLTFSLEGLAVGWMLRRRQEIIVEAELLYWIFLGAPLALLTYRYLLDLPLTAAGAVSLQQPLNALINSVVASSLVLVVSVRWRSDASAPPIWPLRAYLVHLVTVITMIPVLVGSVWHSTWLASQIQEELQTAAEQAGRTVEEQVHDWVQDYIGAVSVVAHSISSLEDTERLQRLLDEVSRAFPAFHNIYVGDATATAVASHPREDATGEPTIGLNLADRSYFQRAQQAAAPFVTDAFQGRGGTDEIISNIVAPIHSESGRFLGYVVGAINLSRLQERIQWREPFPRTATVILTDSQGQVLISSDPRWKQMEPFHLSDLGTVTRLGQQMVRVLPDAGSAIANWMGGYQGWVSTEPHTGWTTITLMPIGPSAASVFRDYIASTGAGLILITLAVLVIRLLNHRITRPLEQLAAVARHRLTAPDAPWPAYTQVAELNDLISSLSEAAAHLRTAQHRLTFLAEVSHHLAASLDHRQTLTSLAQFVVGDVADLCAIWLIRPDEEVVRLVALHANDAVQGPLDGLRSSRPAVLDPTAVTQNIRDAKPRIIDGSELVASGSDAACRLDSLGVVSGMLLPLSTRTGAHGVILLGRTADRPPFAAADLEFAQNLADRTALALENALLYEKSVHAALHDPLTGLPNRAHFLEAVAQALARVQGAADRVAVLLIDLDGFKRVNDRTGHHAGDLLLRQVADRLRTMVRDGDALARHGGDEFTLLLHDAPSVDAVIATARAVIRQLDAPFVIFGQEFFVPASIGIALGSDAGSPAELVRYADIAMEQAKRNEESRIQLYSPELGIRIERRLQLETDLRHAAARGELMLHYQPLVSLATGQITGVEALVRWNHPRYGVISPSEFIPIAEEVGLAISIGQWVLTEACRQLRRWRAEIPAAAALTMSVNLSPKQLRSPDIVRAITGVLETAHVPPSALQLELTENEAMQAAGATEETLRRLKKLGVAIAIDDFGTGYSSLSYLNRFPVDVLKIDRSFIADLRRNQPLVRTVITMARALELKVVAEGVETREQEAELRAMGCDYGQGFLYAKPLPAEEMTRLLANREALVD